ncbi:MAG: CRISPR-associated helicase Cas3', partial [bacterium]|nr:CRISPR-associated helicase Cas3' [bacterium]
MNNIFKYWGKARQDKNGEWNYHLLPYHCLDVAAVGRNLLECQPALLQQFANLSRIDSKPFLRWTTFLLAIHDIGKFADGFQNMQPDLLNLLQKRSIQSSSNEHHSSLGYRFCEECLTSLLVDNENVDDLWDLLQPWINAVTGHHGQPPQLDLSPPPIQMQFHEHVRNDALGFIQGIIPVLLQNGLPFRLDAYDRYYEIFPRVSWLLAGLTVLADWIGSNREWFPYYDKPMPLTDYWHDVALPQAKTAVAECGLTVQAIAPFSGMRMLFPAISSLTPLQQLAEKTEIVEGPQLFIIEEVTGGGKTEAALTLAHRLMDKGMVDGLFIALPTMATANAMYKRIQEMYLKLFSENSHPSLILAHSASRMVLDMEQKNLVDKGYGHNDSSASQDCTVWLSDSRKKSLLAHVGVGTIDQTLLAILAVRHQSLRLLGLARKVLIVDEVHACDAYVHRLLCTLLKFHASQGGMAILLSATLPQAMRAELINSFANGLEIKDVTTKKNDYPLLTHFSQTEEIQEVPVAARKALSRTVKVQPLYSSDEVNEVLQEMLDADGCACWVRNTVYDAMQSYREWVDRLGKDGVMLFHARFTMCDRLRIEDEVIRCFGLKSTTCDRQKKLLIATQVVEQSLDLDFDFMVSDLAPIDLLIQRAGRLQRHARGQRKQPVLGVYMPQLVEKPGKDWFKKVFPKASRVYDHHGHLWLTAKWLCKHQGFTMPENAREMIESVYGESSQVTIPNDLQLLEDQADGKDMADKSQARFNSLNLHEGYQATMTQWQDDVSAPTRLGEPTVTVRLARWDGNQLVSWSKENTGHDWELSQITVRKSQIAKEDTNNLPTCAVEIYHTGYIFVDIM